MCSCHGAEFKNGKSYENHGAFTQLLLKINDMKSIAQAVDMHGVELHCCEMKGGENLIHVPPEFHM